MIAADNRLRTGPVKKGGISTQRFFTIVNHCLTIEKVHCARIRNQDAEPQPPSPRFGLTGSMNYESIRVESESYHKLKNREKEKQDASFV